MFFLSRDGRGTRSRRWRWTTGDEECGGDVYLQCAASLNRDCVSLCWSCSIYLSSTLSVSRSPATALLLSPDSSHRERRIKSGGRGGKTGWCDIGGGTTLANFESGLLTEVFRFSFKYCFTQGIMELRRIKLDTYRIAT
ncbi:hypothetical protein LZ32DRAFT_316978 [Colletotrichum eremochloae]|nr:hypothetical protein LZ32DRAFT_316978 [Colletotrichum eremochloae]